MFDLVLLLVLVALFISWFMKSEDSKPEQRVINHRKEVLKEPLAPVPTAPKAPQCDGSTFSSLHLFWTKDEPVITYEIQYKEEFSLNAWKTIFVSGNDVPLGGRVSGSLENLTPQTPYRVRLRAQNLTGWSQFSPLSEIFLTLRDVFVRSGVSIPLFDQSMPAGLQIGQISTYAALVEPDSVDAKNVSLLKVPEMGSKGDHLMNDDVVHLVAEGSKLYGHQTSQWLSWTMDTSKKTSTFFVISGLPEGKKLSSEYSFMLKSARWQKYYVCWQRSKDRKNFYLCLASAESPFTRCRFQTKSDTTPLSLASSIPLSLCQPELKEIRSSSPSSHPDLTREKEGDKDKEKEQTKKGKKLVSKESDDEDDSKKCVTCLDANKNAFLDPCGHIALCMSCAKQLKKCPICRREIHKVVQSFLV